MVVPIITAVVIVMGNVALSNEALGALFPWKASYLLVRGGLAQIDYPYSLMISLIAVISIFGFLQV